MTTIDEKPTIGERNALTAERLYELLHYSPETGVFTRRKTVTGTARIGTVAGCVTADGRRTIRVDGKTYKAYRLAWLYMTGKWPCGVIDHMDGNSLNDRFVNLRDVDVKTNLENQRQCTDRNALGFLGVSECPEGFRAGIKTEGKSINLGAYETPEEAHQAYLDAKRALHAGCTI